MVPLPGSRPGRPAGPSSLWQALALWLALALAVLAAWSPSILAGAIPSPKPDWGGRGHSADAPVLRSVVLDPRTGQLQVLQGLHPGAVAWANLSDAIQQTG